MSAFRLLLRFRAAERAERSGGAASAAPPLAPEPPPPDSLRVVGGFFYLPEPELGDADDAPDVGVVQIRVVRSVHSPEWKWDSTLPDDEPRTGPVGPLLEELFENKVLQIGPYTLRLVHGYQLIQVGVEGIGGICVPPVGEPRSWTDFDAVRRVAIVHARSLIAAILAGREVRWLATGWTISSAQTEDEVERRPERERWAATRPQLETIRWETT